MPHLHVKKFKSISFPTQYNEIEFEFLATNIKHQEERLIATRFEGKSFFLLIKESENKVLIKSDKLTRPSPNYLINMLF